MSEPTTEAGRAYLREWGHYADPSAILAIESEARQQGVIALDEARLAWAITVAVGSTDPDDFGIEYRGRRGFSPSGLAAAIRAALASEPQEKPR